MAKENEALYKKIQNEKSTDSLQKLKEDLGKMEKIDKLDWNFPKQACKTTVKIHKEQLTKMASIKDKSESLSNFAKKVLEQKETFVKFIEEIGSGLTTLFHKDRIKLKKFILEINFNGDENKMLNAYKDNKKWIEDLNTIVLILEESENASEQKIEALIKSEETLPDCSLLPDSNEAIKEVTKISTKFIGSYYLLKQVAKCIDLKGFILTNIIEMAVEKFIKYLVVIFGVGIFKVLKFAFAVTKIIYFVYKANSSDNENKIDEKYRYYGKAAGTAINLIFQLLFGRRKK